MDYEFTDEEYTKVVNDDIRGVVSEEIADWLRSDDEVEEFYDKLCSLRSDVELQLTTNKGEVHERRATHLRQNRSEEEWHTFLAENERWKAGAIRFRNGVDNRIREVKRIVKDLNESLYDD